MNDFQSRYGPWALVTGASAGIGKAIAHELAARKLNIVAVARRQNLLKALKDELEGRYRIDVHTMALDLTEPGAVEKIARAAEDMEIGLVVPAAGMAIAGEFTAAAPERNAAMAQLNMVVPMQLVQRFAGRMAERGRGGVLLVSSLFAYQGIPYLANYAATKAYLLTLGEALHVELGRQGIDVSVLSPGLTDTDMPAGLPLDFSKLPMLYQSPQEVARTGVRALPALDAGVAVRLPDPQGVRAAERRLAMNPPADKPRSASPGARKWMLFLHLLCIGGWLGATVAMAFLGLLGRTTGNPEVRRAAYLLMSIMDRNLIVPLVVASILTGVILALRTQWGLFRHFWVMAKLAQAPRRGQIAMNRVAPDWFSCRGAVAATCAPAPRPSSRRPCRASSWASSPSCAPA